MKRGIIKMYPYDPYRRIHKTWDQMGKKVKITDHQVKLARSWYLQGNNSIRNLAFTFKVSYAYMYDLLSRKYRPFI